MNIEITRPRGQSVAVDLGQAQEVIKKYQSMMTLGFTWNRSRIACWKDLEALPQQSTVEFSVDYADPNQLLTNIRQSIKNIIESRRHRRQAQYQKNISDIMGTTQMSITHPGRVYRGQRLDSAPGRVIKLELYMSPYDVSKFAREMNALIKKYDRNTVRRGWQRALPNDIAERYLRRY